MPYLDNLLASGEQPIRRTHQHWFVLVADARYAIFLTDTPGVLRDRPVARPWEDLPRPAPVALGLHLHREESALRRFGSDPASPARAVLRPALPGSVGGDPGLESQ